MPALAPPVAMLSQFLPLLWRVGSLLLHKEATTSLRVRERQSAFARRGGVASPANAGPGEVRIPSARCDMMFP
jgi:hypothetical protein